MTVIKLTILDIVLLFCLSKSYCVTRIIFFYNTKMKPLRRNSSKLQSQNHINRGKMNIPNTYIHHHSLSRFIIGTLIICGRFKLVVWVQTYPNNEVMQSCKSFPQVNTHIKLSEQHYPFVRFSV